MTTFMIAWHRTMRTPATTSTERRAHSSQVVLSCLHPYTRALWLKFESFMSSPCAWSSVRSLHLDPPFLLLALPSAPFFFLNYLKSVVNLHNSCNESMDSTDEFSLSTLENSLIPRLTSVITNFMDCATLLQPGCAFTVQVSSPSCPSDPDQTTSLLM